MEGKDFSGLPENQKDDDDDDDSGLPENHRHWPSLMDVQDNILLIPIYDSDADTPDLDTLADVAENHRHLSLMDIQDGDVLDTDILLIPNCDSSPKDENDRNETLKKNHPGNRYFQKYLQEQKLAYIQYPTWRKMGMVEDIVAQLRKEGIRFLEKRQNDRWYDVGNIRMQVKISQILQNRELEFQRGLLSNKTIDFAIVHADICEYGGVDGGDDLAVDIVAMKYAQEFYGVDLAVSNALDKVGISHNEFRCEPNIHRFRNTNGGIPAKKVLCIGMPDLFSWDFIQVQEFSRRALKAVYDRNTMTVRHLALTMHGVEFGMGMRMEEIECFLAGFRGCLIAMHLGHIPSALERITLVERNGERVKILQQVLEQVVADVDFADPIHNNSIRGCRIHPLLIPAVYDPLQPLQVRPTTTKQDGNEVVDLSIQFTKPSVPPDQWCISYEQLMKLNQRASSFYGPERYPGITMRDICEDIIKPSCARTGSSYALHLNPTGLPIDAFVSHSWDGHFSAFCQSIRSAFQTTMIKPNLWICAFALLQIQGQDDDNNTNNHRQQQEQQKQKRQDVISQQIGASDEPLDESPFVQAIQKASLFCVVRNSQKDIYRRIWCVCELMYAQQCQLFPSKTHATGPEDVTFAADS